MTVLVRPGGEVDFWAVARIWVNSWQIGYAGIVPQPVLDALDPADRHRGLLTRAADPADDTELLVATQDGTVVGFAVIGAWRGADGRCAADGAGEVRAIYVAPEQWGRGVGATLMAGAVQRLDALALAPQRLWVLEANDRGRRFYESVGWCFDGQRQEYVTGGATLPELRYVRRQTPQAHQSPRADVSVRPAGAADAAEIAGIQLSTWRTAYARVLPARILDTLTVDEVTAQWAAAVTRPPSPRHRVLVALEREWTVGFSALGPVDDGDGAGEPSALLATLLVEPRWGRRGHGSRLLAATVELLRQDGYTNAVTWLLEQDRICRSFFQSAGWELDGAARTLDMDGRLVTEVRLHTSLATPD